MFAALVSTLVCTATLNYQMTKTPDIRTPEQKDHSTSAISGFFAASIIWGTLKVFAGVIYNGLLWWFLVGAILPVPFYFLGRKWKISSTSMPRSSFPVAEFGLLTT